MLMQKLSILLYMWSAGEVTAPQLKSTKYLINLVDFAVPIQLFDRIFRIETIASKNLNGI